MFVVKKERDETINWPVTVETPVDGGKIKKFEFTGTFKLLDDDQKDEIAEDAKSEASIDSPDEAANEWKRRAVDRILKFMCGWKSVVDEAGMPIDFSRDNLQAAARSPQGVSLLRGINTAINEINVGTRTKN